MSSFRTPLRPHHILATLAKMNGSPVLHHPLLYPTSVSDRSPTPSISEPTHSHNFSTEPPNPPSPVPDKTADILRVACMRGDLANLQERILNAVTTTTTTTNDGETISPSLFRLLFAFLRTLGVDFAPALAALESTEAHRCTRCSASFRIAENTPTACTVPHAAPLVAWDIELVADGVEPCETRYYVCCGTCVVVSSGAPPEEDPAMGKGMCYVGPHVAAPIPDVKAGSDCDRADAGKTHLQARPGPSVLEQLPVPVHGPGTCVPRPVFGLEEGKSVPSQIATSAWVNAAGGTGKSAAGQYQHQHQHRHRDLGRGRPPVNVNGTANSAGSWTTSGQRPREANIWQTMPWRQSSLYHPPGWIAIPPGLRRAGDPPFA
ncbi:hypothetical protein C8T65DRAFT_627359 [Cerioporus squamosus]|nr:hypothetical protein C8T65DRAFT_627359 [Cerioporus squamosus]